MFTDRIRIVGKHAMIVKKYSKDKQSDEKTVFRINDVENIAKDIYLFDTMMDFALVAMALGIVENRVADEDNNNQNNPATIFSEMIIKKSKHLERILHHITLSDVNEPLDLLVKKAFGIHDDDYKKRAMTTLLSYMRGGLEFFDEMMASCKTYEDILVKILELRHRYVTES